MSEGFDTLDALMGKWIKILRLTDYNITLQTRPNLLFYKRCAMEVQTNSEYGRAPRWSTTSCTRWDASG